jgi:DNA-binding transcriptional LysR family regulator
MTLPEIRLLQAAIALSEALNFSRAAERLHVVQPTLSKQILELESQLGFRLFIRTSQSVEMTDACYPFVQEAKEAVFHAERAVNLARATAQGAQSVINIGRSPYVDPYLVSMMSTVTLPLYPGVQLSYTSLLAPELEHRVMMGKLDLAIITEPTETPKLIRTWIARQPLYVAMSLGDSLASKYAVAIRDLDERDCILFERNVHPAIYDGVFALADKEHIKFRQVQHVMSAEGAAQMLREGHRVAILTRTGAWRIAEHGITKRPLVDDALLLRTALVMRSDNRSRILIEFTKAYMTRLAFKPASQLKLKLAS